MICKLYSELRRSRAEIWRLRWGLPRLLYFTFNRSIRSRLPSRLAIRSIWRSTGHSNNAPT
jgi:hypothetical protein